MDVHTRETRSYNMSQIKGKNTKTEETVRKYLFGRGLRYRKNDKRLPRHPDIVLPKYKTVVLVNGCFWHVHEGCKYFKWPESNVKFWKNKLTENRRRNVVKIQALKELDWKVIVVWECEVKGDNQTTGLNKLYLKITQREQKT